MPEQTFVVANVLTVEPKPDKGYGPMKSIRMELDGEGVVEWYTKAQTQEPLKGQSLVGTVEDSQYGKKFKKAQQGGGGSGFRADPKKDARITRLAAQTRAIQTLELAHKLGVPVPKCEKIGELVVTIQTVANLFERDAQQAGDKA